MSAKKKQISAEDYIAIQNLMASYQWLIDGGDTDRWASLFTEDGFFTNNVQPPAKGHAELKKLSAGVMENYGGNMRHLMGNFYVEYGASTDEAFAKFYNMVTTWAKDEGAKFFCMAISTTHLGRVKGEWKIKSNTIQMLNNV